VESALKIQQLTVNYEKNPVLWDISFEVPQGKLVAICGPNGAGKSTLLKTALGLIKPITGEILFFGKPFKEVRKQVGYIPQREEVDWDFPITLFDLVLMGRYGRKGVFGRINKKDKQDAWHYLSLVGLKEFAKRQINQLSGGQQQRAFLARALMQEADLYLMDEAFAGIDAASIKALIAILQQFAKQGKTFFIVHHDLESVRQIFNWVILLNLRLVGYGSVETVFTPEMIQKTYGRETALFDEAARLSQERALGLTSS
jgi:manganese/zinc/iron transport system ATP- binding protein